MTILNTSLSGMLADSNWLSSISQDVTNANTPGYKNAETKFSTLVDQVSAVATGGGVMTSALDLNTLQGLSSPPQTGPEAELAEKAFPLTDVRLSGLAKRLRGQLQGVPDGRKYSDVLNGLKA
jgi:hypothetical protein